MFFFVMSLVMGLAVFVIVAPIFGFSRQRPSSLRFMTVFSVAGISLSVVRVTGCWAVFYLTRTGQRDINLLPLGLFTLPEALLLPESDRWTTGDAILLSVLLVIGSSLWAALFGWSMSHRAGRSVP